MIIRPSTPFHPDCVEQNLLISRSRKQEQTNRRQNRNTMQPGNLVLLSPFPLD